MSSAPVLDTTLTDAEWARVELLARCLLEARQGRPATDAALERLQALQDDVETGRRHGGRWRAVAPDGLDRIEYDLLACAVAPEAEPAVGWLFQALQPSAPSPYPTPALVHELLVCEPPDGDRLREALRADRPLRRLGLLTCDEDGGPYDPVRPAPGVTDRLLARAPQTAPPPGARLVRLRPGWADLVLPADRLAMLRELLLWVRHRGTVTQAWGARDAGGPVALFAGPSGTGKTVAAAVVATELGWPLYRVDIGSLVSKYVGETEANLNRLLDAAHEREMVLLFDEAESLFGQRGEVRDARDRYANLEISHLLSRLEEHVGPCILTTNLRGHLDPAFVRRFQVVVEFPRPDAVARAQLWARLLPPRAPRTVDVVPDALAAVPLTGGNIANAAVHAAILAAAAQGPVGLPEIAVAVWRELGKGGNAVTPADLGPLAEALPHRRFLC